MRLTPSETLQQRLVDMGISLEAFEGALLDRLADSLRDTGMKLALSPPVAPTPCACCRLVEVWPFDADGLHVALLARIPIEADVGHVPAS